MMLGKEPQPPKIGLGPAGASQGRSDCLGAEGFAEVMIDQKHPSSVRVLVEMVGTSVFCWAKPVALQRSLPVLGAEISEGSDVHTRRQGRG
jgi:hypothetical protein